MSELHEPITELTADLRIPAERELPTAVRETQRQMLLAEVAAEGNAPALTFGRRLAAAVRAFGLRIGLLLLLVCVCLATSVAVSGGRGATKAVEVTAATGALTSVAFAAARVEGTSLTRGAIPRVKRATHVRQLDAQPNF
jgi:hypothetical protein